MAVAEKGYSDPSVASTLGRMNHIEKRVKMYPKKGICHGREPSRRHPEASERLSAHDPAVTLAELP